jgi:dihydroorotase (multifunctional complex type)
MFDLAVMGAEVWQDNTKATRTNIYITGEKIARITTESLEAKSVFDAAGLTVLPGLIDTHSHHRDPGFTHKEDIETATAAAAVGGVTVTLAMPNVNPPTATVETLVEQIENYGKNAIVDWNINPSASNPALLQDFADLGCIAFKVYMVVDSKRPYPHMPTLGIHNHAHILEIMEAAKDTGLPLMVHPNDQAIFELQEKRHFENGVIEPEGYGKQDWLFENLAWNSGVATLLEINHFVKGRLHLCHMLSDRMLDLVRRSKADGDDVTSEVNAFALFLSDPDEMRELGPYAMGRLLKPEWLKALWDGIADRTIDVLGTDHAPHSREEKEIGWTDMWKAPSGTPAIQHYLMKLLDSAHKGLITMQDVVRITSFGPATRFGLYPKKGVIAEGSDADIVIVDLNATHTITDEEVLSKCGWSAFRGQTIKGVPKATILRGQFVMKDLKLIGKRGVGKMAKRV